MRNVLTWRLGALPVSVALMLACAATAAAGDAKVYPGSLCNPDVAGYNIDASEVADDTVLDWFLVQDRIGLRTAAGTQVLNVTCPITRDNVTGTLQSASVDYYDGTSNGAVSCYFVNRLQVGDSGYEKFSTSRLSSYGGKGFGRLTGLTTPTDNDWGTFEIRCLIPEGSYISRIQYEEP